MLALLIAAVAIGVAFNAMNPLGIRSSADSVASPVAASGDVYQNETSIIKLGSDAASAPAQQPGLYENSTVRTTLEAKAPQRAQGVDDKVITWLETKKLVAAGSIVLVDARAAIYYQTEHIPGAVSLPAGESTDADFATFAARYPKNTPLVVYCGSLSCPLSRNLIAVLTGRFGYTNVRDMAGGYVEYRETEEALTKGTRQ
jgi:rhodanese-related sulfurtransferase